MQELSLRILASNLKNQLKLVISELFSFQKGYEKQYKVTRNI